MAGVEVGFAAPLLPHLLGPWQGVRTQLCSGHLLTQAGLLCAPAPPKPRVRDRQCVIVCSAAQAEAVGGT